MEVQTLCSILSMLCMTISVNGAKILALLPMAPKSQTIIFNALVEELVASRKHEVTYVTLFKTKEMPGLRTIYLDKPKELVEAMTNSPVLFDKMVGSNSILELLFVLKKLVHDTCQSVVSDPAFVKFMENPGNFDVIIGAAFMGECWLGLAPVLRAPLIVLPTTPLLINDAWFTNTPFPLSYVPHVFLPFSSEMNFWERLTNFVYSLAYLQFNNWVLVPTADAVILKNYPNAVSSTASAKNASLYLTNSHFSLEDPRPTMPNVIEIGALHCRPGQKLPEQFQKFVDGSGDDGFIVLSLGSVVKGKVLPKDLVDKFIYAFSNVKQRVIWKYEETLDGLPTNVMITDWLPQQDLMGNVMYHCCRY